MKRPSQYSMILAALRKAGAKGCTVRDLLRFTNYPSARLFEMTAWTGGAGKLRSEYQPPFRTEFLFRTWRQHNGKRIRVYVLRRV